MRVLKGKELVEIVKDLCMKANYDLPEDVQNQLIKSRERETFPVAQGVLDTIIENFGRAEEYRVPICQDTGLTCVFLSIGDELFIEGNIEENIQEGIRQGYAEGYLRKSMVQDPINRINTGDNTPGMIYYEFTKGDKLKITVAPKGFGSENMSQLKMLKPADGIEGVKEFVLKVVKEAGPNACPPLIVGVGIGGNFDKCAYLAKKALLRPIEDRNPNPYYSNLEQELLEDINRLGIGPQGFGGKTTALGVNIEVMGTHIAGLPCSVNINCHVTRHQSIVL